MAKFQSPKVKKEMRKVYAKRTNYRRQLLLERMTFYTQPVKAAFLRFYSDHLGYEGYSNFILSLINREYEQFKRKHPKAHDAFIASLPEAVINPASEPINIPIPLKPSSKAKKVRVKKMFKIKVKKGLNPISSALSDSTDSTQPRYNDNMKT